MVAAAADNTTVAFVFKRRYSDGQVAMVTQRDHPTYNLMSKVMGLGGQDFAYATVTGNPQGVGNTLADAITAVEVLKGEQFVATDRLKYGYITLDGPSINRYKANNATFVNFITSHTDGVLETLGDEIAFDLFRDGTGLRGRRASISGNTITLTDIRDVHNFRRGMTIIAATGVTGTGARTGSTKVTQIIRSAKKIVVADASAISSFSDNDYLFRLGQTATNGFEGMGACTPLVAPTSGVLFRNVDRANDTEALAGTRIDDTSVLPEDQIGDLAVQVSLIGKRLERAVVYPTVFQSIVKRLGAKVSYINPAGKARIGFQTIMLDAAGYTIEVVADPDIVPSEIRAFKNDAHDLRYLGSNIVHLIRDDGNLPLRIDGVDGIAYRARSQANYLQPDQASHGVATYQP
jgi:hypothetical protein